jgi:hypothetical protein
MSAVYRDFGDVVTAEDFPARSATPGDIADNTASTSGLLCLLAVQLRGAHSRNAVARDVLVERIMAMAKCSASALRPGETYACILTDGDTLQIQSTGLTLGWDAIIARHGALVELWECYRTTPFHGAIILSDTRVAFIADIVLFTLIANGGAIGCRTAAQRAIRRFTTSLQKLLLEDISYLVDTYTVDVLPTTHNVDEPPPVMRLTSRESTDSLSSTQSSRSRPRRMDAEAAWYALQRALQIGKTSTAQVVAVKNDETRLVGVSGMTGTRWDFMETAMYMHTQANQFQNI